MFFLNKLFDVSNYSFVISNIAFSKCTKFFNNCLIETSLIITKSRAKLKVILSKNYCKCERKVRARPPTFAQNVASINTNYPN